MQTTLTRVAEMARESAAQEGMLRTDGRRALQSFAEWLEQMAERERRAPPVELRTLFDRAEAAEARWQSLALANIEGKSADERFNARLELDAAYNAKYDAWLAFNEASREFDEVAA